MAITIKDFIATLLAGVIGLIYYIELHSLSVPLIENYRGPILVVTILGLIVCMLDIPSKLKSGRSTLVVSSLLTISVGLVLIGLITGSKTIFTYITGMIMLIWTIATFRHILNI